MTDHWIANADRYDGSANPLWGHIAECDRGELWLPSWKRHKWWPDGYWDRRLNLRNPLHWAPYLRSRLTNHVVMVETL